MLGGPILFLPAAAAMLPLTLCIARCKGVPYLSAD